MLVTMSDKELNRINVIQAVIDKRMRRRDAAHQLNLTERQIQRLMNRYRESGVSGLASLRRGQPGNHRIPESLKLRILALLREKYSDFGPTFRVNHAARSKSGTQFGRVLHDIGVELICANSPQAKGRVERANKTLQDRLIKEMRLNKISSIEEANAWLETFFVNFNQRFAKTPKYPKNLHRPVAETIVDLDDIFSWQETRKL